MLELGKLRNVMLSVDTYCFTATSRVDILSHFYIKGGLLQHVTQVECFFTTHVSKINMRWTRTFNTTLSQDFNVVFDKSPFFNQFKAFALNRLRFSFTNALSYNFTTIFNLYLFEVGTLKNNTKNLGIHKTDTSYHGISFIHFSCWLAQLENTDSFQWLFLYTCRRIWISIHTNVVLFSLTFRVEVICNNKSYNISNDVNLEF